MKNKGILFLIISAFILWGCNKDKFYTGGVAVLSVSADTLSFDTVFTSTGSTTRSFKVFNGSSGKLRIDAVTLSGGAASAFRINADGISGPAVKNLDLDPGDSLYVFATVTINPSAANLPFIVRDSIFFTVNGTQKTVQLQAWGRNAHFLKNIHISGTTAWTNDLPYVIQGGITVDPGGVLSVGKGCHVYLHADAPFFVNGTLLVNGNSADSDRVYFSGDRLDYPYNEYPAAWPGIFIRGSALNNKFQYAVIRNAYQGVVVQDASVNASPKLILNQCIIDNIYDAGLYGINTSIAATNCLISNCGKNVQLVYGGNYQFVHCSIPTVSGYYINHRDPALYISNGVQQGGAIYSAPLSAAFTNCLIWGQNGTAANEVVTAKYGTDPFNVSFTNCLWKVKDTPASLSSATNIIANQDPRFDSINVTRQYFSFRLQATSPAVNKGAATTVTTDLDGHPRPVGAPDIGAYERQ